MSGRAFALLFLFREGTVGVVEGVDFGADIGGEVGSGVEVPVCDFGVGISELAGGAGGHGGVERVACVGVEGREGYKSVSDGSVYEGNAKGQ